MNLVTARAALTTTKATPVDQSSGAAPNASTVDATRQARGLDADGFDGTATARVGVDGTSGKVTAPHVDDGQSTSRAPRVRTGLSGTGSSQTGTASTGLDPANPLSSALNTIRAQLLAAANANQNPGG